MDMEVMTLANTAKMMTSTDYKERFKAEYYQVKIRLDRLEKVLVKYEAGTLNFEASCPLEVLKAQAQAMRQYLYVLEVRAEIEKIEI